MAATTTKERVVEEKRELDIKLDKLTEFLKNPNVPQSDLLNKQHQLMQDYSNVLAERLAKW